MRKIYLSLVFVLAAAAAFAQNKTVTLRVDMTGQTVSADGVHVAGNFQVAAGFASDWTPNITPLTNEGNGLYTVTISVPAGTYEYKYINGNAWGGDELGITSDCGSGGIGTLNRLIVVSTDSVLPAFLFNTCTVSIRSSIEGDLSATRPVRVYPNPMTNESVFEFSNEARSSYTFRMTTINGQVVREVRDFTGDAIAIERGTLASGLYFLSLINEAGEVYNTKMTIE
ncbi:MAG: T9SS type A sorting domain-containing protein [Bacteroidia bacterium]|nr:T9SS type A sorting domain-containing protein [Bacteroidia bacterium]